MEQLISEYIKRMHTALELPAMKEVPKLAAAMQLAWKNKKTIYLCGNGGSAGNANHLANDFLYGAGVKNGIGLRIDSLSANPAVITCLANDVGYEHIFSEQLAVLANEGDLLVALSGSGNSPNILRVLAQSKAMGVKSYAILGYSGGKAKEVADVAIRLFDLCGGMNIDLEKHIELKMKYNSLRGYKHGKAF